MQPTARSPGRPALAALAVSCAGMAWAQPAPPLQPTALGLSCLACHGPGQRPGARTVDLRTRAPRDLAQALRGFRDGERTGSVMPRLVQPLSDEDIRRLAAELGTPPP